MFGRHWCTENMRAVIKDVWSVDLSSFDAHVISNWPVCWPNAATAHLFGGQKSDLMHTGISLVQSITMSCCIVLLDHVTSSVPDGCNSGWSIHPFAKTSQSFRAGSCMRYSRPLDPIFHHPLKFVNRLTTRIAQQLLDVRHAICLSSVHPSCSTLPQG